MKSLIALLFFLSIATVGCKNADERISSASDEGSMPAAEAITLAMPAKTMGQAGNDQAGTTSVDQKIIREATLRFETQNLVAAYAQVVSAVKKHQAQIQSDVSGKNYESVFRNITVRIPNRNFDSFVADVGKGVSYFDRKEISSRDVTEEYIDIDARLKAKKVLETRYLELLKKAAKVSEILEIEKELATVREEIEAKEGQLKYLENHVAMSTVTIELYKKTALEGGVTASYGSKMWNAIKSGFNGISAFFIGLLYIWPFIIILVALTFWLRKKFKKKTV